MMLWMWNFTVTVAGGSFTQFLLISLKGATRGLPVVGLPPSIPGQVTPGTLTLVSVSKLGSMRGLSAPN